MCATIVNRSWLLICCPSYRHPVTQIFAELEMRWCNPGSFICSSFLYFLLLSSTFVILCVVDFSEDEFALSANKRLEIRSKSYAFKFEDFFAEWLCLMWNSELVSLARKMGEKNYWLPSFLVCSDFNLLY